MHFRLEPCLPPAGAVERSELVALAEETAAAASAAAMPSAQPPPAGGQQGSGQAADSLVASLLQAMSSQRSEGLGDASSNTEVELLPAAGLGCLDCWGPVRRACLESMATSGLTFHTPYILPSAVPCLQAGSSQGEPFNRVSLDAATTSQLLGQLLPGFGQSVGQVMGGELFGNLPGAASGAAAGGRVLSVVVKAVEAGSQGSRASEGAATAGVRMPGGTQGSDTESAGDGSMGSSGSSGGGNSSGSRDDASHGDSQTGTASSAAPSAAEAKCCAACGKAAEPGHKLKRCGGCRKVRFANLWLARLVAPLDSGWHNYVLELGAEANLAPAPCWCC